MYVFCEFCECCLDVLNVALSSSYSRAQSIIIHLLACIEREREIGIQLTSASARSIMVWYRTAAVPTTVPSRYLYYCWSLFGGGARGEWMMMMMFTMGVLHVLHQHRGTFVTMCPYCTYCKHICVLRSTVPVPGTSSSSAIPYHNTVIATKYNKQAMMMECFMFYPFFFFLYLP